MLDDNEGSIARTSSRFRSLGKGKPVISGLLRPNAPARTYLSDMTEQTSEVGPSRGALPEWIITVGGSMFIIVLYVAAYWEPDIRWLHFLQSWMYIVAIALSWRGNSWGYFIGISAAALWNYPLREYVLQEWLATGFDPAA